MNEDEIVDLLTEAPANSRSSRYENDPPGRKGPAIQKGAPSGQSRLSAYSLVIGAVVITVLFLTVTSMVALKENFGDQTHNTATDTLTETEKHPEKHKNFPQDNFKPEMTAVDNSGVSEGFKAEGEQATTTDGEDPVAKMKADLKGQAEANYKAAQAEKKKKKEEEKKKKKREEEEAKKKEEEEAAKKREEDDKIREEAEKKHEEDEQRKREEDEQRKKENANKDLLTAATDARNQMIETFKGYYGSYFDDIFKDGKNYKTNELFDREEGDNAETPEKLRLEYLPFRPFGPRDLYHTNHFSDEEREQYKKDTDEKWYHSIVNLRRKMMIKILQAQQRKKNGEGTKYVWATGGHSAAAGHGNLFKETYTKVFEREAKHVFEAVGLELEARNYAMGATSSAAEMSMCFREIYGDDVDIFSWDFAMLEARSYQNGRLLHYTLRGFLSNQHKVVPAFVGLQEVNDRTDMMREMHEAFRGDDPENPKENNGLAMFLNDKKYWEAMIKAVPGTDNKSQQEIDEMPEFVRYFKCQDKIESGEPYCKEKKYSDEVCPERHGMANWHQGWKFHAMVGNAMALFMTQMLVEAAWEIDQATKDNRNLDDVLSSLLEEEEGFRQQMINAKLSDYPPTFHRVYWYNNTSDDWNHYDEEEKVGLETGSDHFKDRWSALDREALFRGPSICHTARVPSNTRFRGIMQSQLDKTGEQVVFGQETYYTGMEDKVYEQNNKDNPQRDAKQPHPMQLVWKEDGERETRCGNEIAKPDYHDFFETMEEEGWTEIEFPHHAEQDAYGYHVNREKYKGMIIMVPRFCGFGDCEKGFLQPRDYADGKWSMKVNGKAVTALTLIGQEAVLVEHEDGIFFEPNGSGMYYMEFKVNEPESFIKISAFILY